MILKIVGEIDENAVSKLINFLDDSNTDYSLEKDVIYLMSEGGFYDDGIMMVDIINRNKDKIILIGCGTLQSAAFEVFFKAECEKHLLPGTRGMFHQANIEVCLNEKWKPASDQDKALKNYMTEFMSDRTKALCKALRMTAQEKRLIEYGEDVWFSYSRMLEFLNVVSQ